MAVIEIVKLRPARGVTESQFLAASDRFEQDYMKKRQGFIRRTLLRGDEGAWAVLVDWDTAANAQASMDAFPNDPASAPFNAVLDPATFEMRRFEVAKVFEPRGA
jgi:hypothetical protein